MSTEGGNDDERTDGMTTETKAPDYVAMAHKEIAELNDKRGLVAAVVRTGEKALAKKAEIEGAASVEEVEVVGWT